MGCPLPAQQLGHDGISDVSDIDHCDPDAADGPQVDTGLERIPKNQVVLHEGTWPQYRGGNGLGVDDPFDEVLACKMRHVIKEGAVERRKVHDPLNDRLAREPECPERLRRLIGRHSIEQEQGVNALQRRAHRGHVRQVALNGLNARWDFDFGCVAANERADSCALPGEPLHDLRSDGAGAACDENGDRRAPCCNLRRWRMMWGAGAVWKRGWAATEGPIGNANGPERAVEGPDLSFSIVSVCR